MKFKLALSIVFVNLLPGFFLLARSQSLPANAQSKPLASEVEKQQTRPVTATLVTVPEERLLWHKTITRTPVPAKGCYKATYPSLTWAPLPCVTAPQKGPTPPIRRLGPAQVGNGVDYSAEAPRGTITLAEGSFDSVTTTGEINRNTAGVYSRENQYSLQMNTKPFSTPLCNNAPSASSYCQGWEQFVFSNDPGSPPSFLWTQYWLLSYGRPCPSGWIDSGFEDCWFNSPSAPFPTQTIQDLANLVMTAKVEGNGTDTATLGTLGSEVYSMNSDSKLTLAPVWEVVEFNVLGDLTLHTAVFNPGTTLVVNVKTDIANGNIYTAPIPVMAGFTGETNNLDLVVPACAYTVFSEIVFKESNVAGASMTCPDFCKLAVEAVESDQKAIANEQQALNTPRCQGPARFECVQAMKALSQKLQLDESEQKKACQ